MYCHKNNKLDADALPPFDETVQVLPPSQSGKESEEVDSIQQNLQGVKKRM